ncbi:MAG: preprotein translocase subunit YajC [Treponema sp.]|nr:preprotein translocase subunit YajC [Treponema sp.]
MNLFIFSLLMGAQQAAGAEGVPPTGGSLLGSFIPFIVIILIFYLLIIRPQSKKRKDTEKMLGALKKGDKVVTIGGLYGTIQSVKETTVIMKVDDNVKLEFLRSAISNVVQPTAVKEEKIEDKNEEKEDSEDETSKNGE